MFSPYSEAWKGDFSEMSVLRLQGEGGLAVFCRTILFAYLSPRCRLAMVSIALPFVSHVGPLECLSVLVCRCDSRGLLL